MSYLFLITSLLLFSLSVVFSPTPLLGLYGFVKFLEVIFFARITQIALSEKEIRIHSYFPIALSIIFVSFLGILQVLHHGSLNSLFYFLGERRFDSNTSGIANAAIFGELFLRPYATFSHPNVFAGYLTLMLFVLLSFRKFWNRRWSQFLILITFSLGSIALLLTLSRTAISMAMISIILCGVYIYRQSVEKRVFRRLLLRLFLLVIFSLFVSSLILPVIGRFAFSSLQEEAVSERLLQVQQATGIIHDSPLFGTGLFGYLPAVSKNAGSLSMQNVMYVHNIYLLLIAETGVVGSLLFFLFLWKTGKRLYAESTQAKQKEKERVAIKVLLLLLLFSLGMTDHYLLTAQQGQLLVGFIFGLVWAFPRTS